MLSKTLSKILKESEQVYEYLSVLLSRLYKNKHIGVLVVDNARVHRARSTALLRRHNFMTYEATTGQHGLEVLTRQSHIKLVIVANDLPGPSGIKMLSEVRQRAKKEDIAVIGLSDRGDNRRWHTESLLVQNVKIYAGQPLGWWL